jgi:hypothetical protein
MVFQNVLDTRFLPHILETVKFPNVRAADAAGKPGAI